MGNKRGQPKTSFFVQRSIAFKVVQYIRRYNLTIRQAWLKLSEVNSKTNKFKKRGFQELIDNHYSNKTAKSWWTENFKSRTVRIQFYKNHIRKWVNEYLDYLEAKTEHRLQRSKWILKILGKRDK